ncbi:Uncharacterised protein [Mycobacteroides abscessus subsp. massiliense]|nr:Uncharacterised protein [Mycobacteroides abscessus subsp. massiliense]
MNTVAYQELQIVHDDIGMGEVDDDAGRGKRLQRVVFVDDGHQVKIPGGLDGLTHGLANLALRSEHSGRDISHAGHPNPRCREGTDDARLREAKSPARAMAMLPHQGKFTRTTPAVYPSYATSISRSICQAMMSTPG